MNSDRNKKNRHLKRVVRFQIEDENHASTKKRKHQPEIYNSRLGLAIAAKNVSLIRDLVNSGADINEYDDYGSTPLLFCVERGNEELLPIFLELGADLELTNKLGQTPLHIAAREQTQEVLKMVLPYCSKNVMNLECGEKKTALIYLMENPRVDAELVNLFIEQGAEVNAGAGSKYSAIHYFIETEMEKFDVLEALLQNCADPDIKNENEKIPIHSILYCHKDYTSNVEKMLNILVKYKVGMHKMLSNNLTYSEYSFFYAVSFNKTNYAKFFIDFGVNVNTWPFEGDTALHHAVFHGNIDIIELLLLHGADINIKDRTGKTPLQLSDWVLLSLRPEIFSKLWEHIFIRRFFKQFVVKENIELFERRKDLREKYEQRCLTEIDQLKEEKIGDDLTLYHVAVMNNERCFRNQTILEKFRNHKDFERIRENYPIFSTTIQRNIKLIFLVNEIDSKIDNSENSFKYLLPNCRDEIFKYLTIKDLKFILLAFSSDPSITPFLNNDCISHTASNSTS